MAGATHSDKAWIMPSLCRPAQRSRASEAVREGLGVVPQFLSGLDLWKTGAKDSGGCNDSVSNTSKGSFGVRGT